jgi:hypothetical protein
VLPKNGLEPEQTKRALKRSSRVSARGGRGPHASARFDAGPIAAPVTILTVAVFVSAVVDRI